MKQPIGILTFHRASNYGAVLQSYALQEEIRLCGGEPLIVNYLCPTVEADHRPRGLFKHHDLLHALIHYPMKLKKDRLFNEFRKRRLITSREMSGSDLSLCKDEYSLFISGSDQVWNDRLSGLDQAYMMAFADEKQRYSYACSFGFDSFPEGREQTYQELLKGIQVVSVRESSAVSMLEKVCIKEQVDVDPTLLLTREQWRNFCSEPQHKGAYILVYTVSGDIELLNVARRLSEKTGIQILYLNNQIKSNRDIARVKYSTPEEFVGWFANAEYVLTNSFHGTVFSIIFNKKAKIELETKKKYNVRSRDLLENCGLSDCILTNTDLDYEFHSDWETANYNLNLMREKSIDYIKGIIGKAKAIEGIVK